MQFANIRQLFLNHRKIILVIGGLLCALTIYFVYASTQKVDPIDQINTFQKAVLTEDLPALKEIIQVEDERLHITTIVRPKFIQLQVDNDEALVNIHVQELRLKRGESKKIGPLFPGVYQANGKASFSYANTTVQKKWEIDLLLKVNRSSNPMRK